MIEPIRIVTSGKIKTDLKTVKKNITFWNDLHHLGLTALREKTEAATWQLANCVLVVREIKAGMTEILLLVARRQVGYQWVMGLQPEQTARESWNQMVQLMPRDLWDASMRLLDHPLPQVRSDVAHLAEAGQMSELARLAHIGEIAQAQYGTDAAGRVTAEAMAKVNAQIAQAAVFKREQDAVVELTPEQLADVFLQMLPDRKTAIKRVRRRTKTKRILQPNESVHPKRKTTEAQWRRDWRRIEPLFNQGKKLQVIADDLGMSRERVGAIIAWATTKDG